MTLFWKFRKQLRQELKQKVRKGISLFLKGTKQAFVEGVKGLEQPHSKQQGQIAQLQPKPVSIHCPASNKYYLRDL